MARLNSCFKSLWMPWFSQSQGREKHRYHCQTHHLPVKEILFNYVRFNNDKYA